MGIESVQSWVASRRMLIPSDLTALGMEWRQKCGKDSKGMVRRR